MTKQEEARVAKVVKALNTVPYVVDDVTYELYGTIKAVLDEHRARRAFVAYWTKAYGVHTLNEDVTNHALYLMAERLRNRGGTEQ